MTWFARALVVLAAALTAVPASASSESEVLRSRASTEVYSLDWDRAIATYRQAVKADPEDAAAYRGLASALWISIALNRGSLTVDDFLGRVSRTNTTPPPPPVETVTAFREAVDRALELARKMVERSPQSADAHFQVGSAIGLRASFVASVEGRPLGAFRAAREAYNEHERVIALDPYRKDAGLIVGTFRYLVSALALPTRWMAYMAGFGGGKERGLLLVEEAASYSGENQTDAKVALVLIYNREKRYDAALKELEWLREKFPRNRLFWLETASTLLRGGRNADAEHILNEGFGKFANDERPKMFGETALWFYKRGLARSGLGRPMDAEQDLRTAVSSEGRKWVHGRAHLELGKLSLKAGERDKAKQELDAAASLCDADSDGLMADEARRILKGI